MFKTTVGTTEKMADDGEVSSKSSGGGIDAHLHESQLISEAVRSCANQLLPSERWFLDRREGY
jgi:hypothetical protein